eukprot:TRINITY_DN2615_c0_g2_i2.p1 TRINITY_DN2615_c0_g2~~TRINITY_DN2615_c0_g2_i2.p1  ORF type:complete len:618 (+),score=265.62 TRINITY_DN2615_c0_g2_i2:71-1855(+)
MAFVVLVAADFGTKVNFELDFPSRPSIPELRERIECDLGNECAARRPGRPFQIHRAQVFDERLEMWVDLMSPSQLESYAQVYVFQRESLYQRDDPGRIPPPTKARAGGAPPTFPASPRGYGALPMHHHSDPFADPHSSRDPHGVRSPRGGAGSWNPGAGAGLRGYDSGGFGQPRASQGIQSLPDSAGHAEKVRAVYEELDKSRRRTVNANDWMDTFEQLQLRGTDDHAPFSDETAEDLFRKGDLDGDGQLSWQEWQQFAEVYPKLLDSLFFRAREHRAKEARAADLDRARDRVADLEKALDDVREATLDADADIEAAKQKAADADADVDAAQQAEQDVVQKKQASGPPKAEAQRMLKEAQKQQAQAKEDGRKREAERRNAQRGIDAAEKRLKQREDERDRSQKELDRLLRLVKAQEDDVAKKDADVQRARDDVDRAKQAAKGLEDPVQERALADSNDAVKQAEEELRSLGDEEAKNDRDLKDAQRELQNARRAREGAERDVRDCQDKAQHKRDAEDRAEKALDDAKEALERLEQEAAAEAERRASQEATENELLQLEVRLREQRLAVEAREAQLRTAHRSFNEDAGRASPRRAG